MKENIYIEAEGKADWDKFYCELTGGLNDARKACVHAIFSKLDTTGCGSVTIENLRIAYSVKSHPKVISGEITEEEAFLEFLACFSDQNNDGRITLTQFCDYYAAVSSLVQHDAHFESLMK